MSFFPAEDFSELMFLCKQASISILKSLISCPKIGHKTRRNKIPTYFQTILFNTEKNKCPLVDKENKCSAQKARVLLPYHLS